MTVFLDQAAGTKKRDRLRRKTHDFRLGVAKGIEVGGGIFENLQ